MIHDFSVQKVNTQMCSNGNDCQHLSPGLLELKVKQDFRGALYEVCCNKMLRIIASVRG